jgi:cytochrome c-type biogenesis protein CcmH/NrfG
MRKCTPFALALMLALPLAASAQVPITESMGRYHSTEEKATQAYNRGVRLMRKAEAAKEPADKAKLYEKAKEELAKAAGYLASYDTYLALGQVYLALGKKESALDACSKAQSLKGSSEAAKACAEQAQREIQQATSGKPPDDGR